MLAAMFSKVMQAAERVRDLVKHNPVLQDPFVAGLLMDGLRYRQDKIK